MRIMYWASFPSRTTRAFFVEEMGSCDEDDLAAVPVLFMRQDSQSSLTLVRPQEGVAYSEAHPEGAPSCIL